MDEGEPARKQAFRSALRLSSFPATRAPGTYFGHQFENWCPKYYHKSVRRLEIPENFRRTQSLFIRAQKPPGGFWVPGSDILLHLLQRRLFEPGYLRLGDADLIGHLHLRAPSEKTL